MRQCRILPAGHTSALKHACTYLGAQGLPLTYDPDTTVTHLLLPVPSFDADGSIKGGGDLGSLLNKLPGSITVIGGFLDHPLLEGYSKLDLLETESYIAKNAAITAHCAIKLALQHLPRTLASCPVLVIGWGRIGKCLSRLLRTLGSDITVAARKETDRAMLEALGYKAINATQIHPEEYRVIFNTAPQLLLPDCPGTALKIDLASKPGITGADVIWARGLPNRDAPESSGALIAQEFISYYNSMEVAL